MVCSQNPLDDLKRDRPDLKRFVAHRIREFLTLAQSLPRARRPRLVAFPCAGWNSCSGFLWGKGAMSEMKNLGWDTVLAPPQLELKQRQRLCRWLKPNAIVFIKARNWKNHPAHFPDIPLVFLIDDADFLDPNEVDHVIACVKSAKLVIAANEYITSWCKQYNPNVEKIWVPHPPKAKPPLASNANRKNIVIWAPADPAKYPTESEFVTKVIAELQSTRDDFEFWMTGCKGKAWSTQFAKPLRDIGVKLKQFGYFQQYSEYLEAIAQASVGLHPVRLEHEYARGKSFGKILSYIVSDTTVVTDTVPDHQDFFDHQSNGMLADSIEEYAQCISYLFDHPQERQSMAQQAYQDFVEQLATPVAAQKLDQAIRNAIQ